MTAGAAATHRWVVFATFDAGGRRSARVIDQLVEYRAIGFEIMVVDTSPEIGAERRDDWERHATRWMQRPNVGYDFASWKAGCDVLVGERRVPVAGLCLILANDSCFGPYRPMAEVLAQFEVEPTPPNAVYGITDSRETSHHHLQSYWLYFRPGAAAEAIEFLRAMPVALDRDDAIRHGELALSEHFERRGFALVAHVGLEALMARCSRHRLGRAASLLEFAVRRVFKRYRHTRRGDGACIKYLLRRPGALDYVNPTLDYGGFLHRNAWSPFVKVMLIRDNPSGDPTLPPRTDVAAMTNDEAAALLRAGRPASGDRPSSLTPCR